MTRAAILAAAPGAPPQAIAAWSLIDPGWPPLGTVLRQAHLIGQCAHESLGFTRTVESLWYSAGRLVAVWPSRFPDEAAAEPYAGNPEALANNVYGGRLGNKEPGDGWRYRGRGYLMLTGRANYRTYGRALGLPLEDHPETAAEPATAWRIALAYFQRRSRGGRTALEWADEDSVEMVTRVVNGGLIGLADRRLKTALAFTALNQPPTPTVRRGDAGHVVLALQHALARHGFPAGPQDGAYGPLTEAAVRGWQRAELGVADGVAGQSTMQGLGLAV